MMLRANQVTQLVDIRSIPRSRHNPQYEQTALEKNLPKHDIDYVYMKDLVGLRPKSKESINLGWRNESFRNYADYMQTPEFTHGIEHLIEIASQKTTAIMCAEAVPWRCHRSLVADALLVRGIEVVDIMNEKTVTPHRRTPFAVVDGTTVVYTTDQAHG